MGAYKAARELAYLESMHFSDGIGDTAYGRERGTGISGPGLADERREED